MDYARMTLRRLQIQEHNTTIVIKGAQKLGKSLASHEHRQAMAEILADLRQQRIELRYWIRQKGGITP